MGIKYQVSRIKTKNLRGPLRLLHVLCGFKKISCIRDNRL